MFGRIKDKLTNVILGELVQDWGTIFRKEGFFEESIDLSLRREKKHWVVWLTYKYKSPISYNKYSFGIPVWDLDGFVANLQGRYDLLYEMSVRQRYGTTSRQDKLPFIHGLFCRAIHGIRASKLLIDLKNPTRNRTEYRLFGYITRKSEIKVFIQSEIDITNSKAHIISGEGFAAALSSLSEFLVKQNNREAGESRNNT